MDTHDNGDKYLQVEAVRGNDVGKKGWIAMSEAIEAGAPAAEPAPSKIFAPPPPSQNNFTDAQVEEGWEEERLIDDGGDEIFIRYEGKPTIERYEFIRDYLDFKLERLKKLKNKDEGSEMLG